MPLTAGQTLAFYEILEPLGAGGMGEVYRARDTRLEREVAIKVLPEELAGDDERLRRFEREAKTLASLNHANVAGIHGVDSDGDTYFLALELVPGEDLAERLRRGALPVDEAIDVGRQIAEGLEAAHEAGVVHRDLKPANVRLTPDGTAKLLDFGLAKPLRVRVAGGSASTAESDSFTATAEGVVLGTPTYMSPEQARGKAVDRRTDLWALGCVLYECLAGRRAFGGESFPDVLAAIAGEEPDWSRLPSLPPRLEELLRRLLVKDPRSRLRDAGEARVQLELARGEVGASPAPAAAGRAPGRASGSRRAPAAVVGVAVVGVALVAGTLGAFVGSRSGSGDAPGAGSGPAGAPRTPLHTELLLPEAAPLAFGAAAFGFDSTLIALSPDGRTLVHVGRDAEGESHLFQRDLTGNGDSVRIDGTAGAITACFSPDGEQLAFLTDDELLRISLDGGRPVALAAAYEPSRVLWREPDRIHFLEQYSRLLHAVPVAGGEVQGLSSIRGRVRLTDILPDGRLLACSMDGSSADFHDVFVSDLDELEDLAGQSPEERRSRIVLENAYDARYHPSGRLVYANGEALYAIDFDLAQGRPVGEPRTIARGVAMDGIAGHAQYALSDSGALVYVDGRDVGTGGLGWVDRDGSSGFLDVEVQRYRTLDLSPDGRTIAIGVGGVDATVELVEVATGVATPLLDRGVTHPLFSHDGTQLQLSGADDRTLRIRALAGDRPPRVIDLEAPFRPSAWTPGDEGVLVVAHGPRSTEVERIDLATGETTPVLSFANALDWSYCFSPDGSHVAFASNRSGRNEVYVRAWPDGRVDHPISRDGGIEVRWCENGDLIWRWGDVWYGTRVTTEPELSWERPEVWFATDFVDTAGVSFDVTGDGQRLYVVKHPEPPQGLRLGHVVGW